MSLLLEMEINLPLRTLLYHNPSRPETKLLFKTIVDNTFFNDYKFPNMTKLICSTLVGMFSCSLPVNYKHNSFPTKLGVTGLGKLFTTS